MASSTDAHVLSEVLENAPTLIIMATTEGRIEYVNKQAFDLSQENLIGRSIYEFIGREYIQELKDAVSKAVESQEQKEVVVSDEEEWFRLRIGPVIKDGLVTSLVFASAIVTKEVKFHEKLSFSEKMLRSILDESPEGIMLIDETGTVIEWNRAQEEIFRLKSEDAIGRKVWDIEHMFSPNLDSNRDIEAIKNSYQKIFETGEGEGLNETRESEIDLGKEKDSIIQQYLSTIPTSKGYMLCGFIHDVTLRRKIQKEKEKAETRYRALFDLNNDAVFIMDLLGNNLDANQSAAELSQYSQEELLTLSYKDLIIERENSETRDKLDEILEVDRFDIYEGIIKKKDVSEVPVEVNISLVRDDEGKPLHIQSIIRDISHRKQTEEELLRSEKKFRMLAENSLQAIQIMQNGQVVYVNQAYCDITGRTREEMYTADNQELWNIIHYEDRDAIRERFRNYAKTGNLEDTNRYRIERPNGEIRWVEANIAIIEFDGRPAMQRTLIDISEQVQAEEALKSERDRAELYLQMAGVIFLVMDANGKIAMINRKGCEIIGYSEEELMGKSWFDFIPISVRDEVKANFQKLIEGEMETIEYLERELLTASGDIKLIAWHTIHLKDDWGNTIGILSSGEDITERKVAQHDLRASQEMLKLVMNNIPHHVFWKDTESRYLGCNEIFAKSAGLESTAEIIGKHDLDLPWKRDESESFVAADKIILDGTTQRYDAIESMTKADGEFILFRTIKVPLTDQDGNIIGVLGTAEDVTEKRRAEIELEESELKIRTLLQSIQDLVFVFDKNDRYAEYYSQDKTSFYVPPAEFLGRHISDVFSQPFSAILLDLIHQVRKSKTERTYDYPLEINGSERWFSARFSLHADGESVVGVVRDITERVKSAEELRQAYQIINMSSVVAFLWRNEEGLPIEYVTGNVMDLFGYSVDEWISGQITYTNVIHPDDLDRFTSEIRGFSTDSLCESFTHEPYRIFTKNGEIRWIQDNTVIRRNDLGLIVHYQGAITDITDRIEIEIALRESEEKYRSVIEQSLMGIAVIDGEERNIKFANSMIANQLHFAINDLLSMDMSSLVRIIHPDDLENASLFLTKIIGGHQPSPIIIRIIRADNQISWFEIFGSKISYGNRPSVQLSAVDISERYRAIEALRRERASFRMIAKSAVLATETEEMANLILEGFATELGLESGTIRLYNPNQETLDPTASFGVPESVAETSIPLKGNLADSYLISRVARSRTRVISSDIRKDMDISVYPNIDRLGFKSLLVMPIINKNGELVGSFSAGSKKPNLISAKDAVFYETIAELLVTVLERKQTEQAYRMSVRRYRELLTDLSEGIGITDLDENFVFVNEAFCNTMGYQKKDLLGTNLTDLVHPEDIGSVRKQTEIRKREESSTYQIRMIRKDGETRIVRISAIPSRDNNGNVEGTVGFFSDITERVIAEEEVRKLNRELTQRVEERTAELAAANKELESFAYTVSHDLRSPLRIINGFSQAILEDYSEVLDEVGKDYLQRIRNGSSNMAKLIDDILGLSKVARAELDLVEVNLSRLAEEVVSELQDSEPDRKVNVDIQPDLQYRCDKRLMRVLLHNLIENSWKFTAGRQDASIHFGQIDDEGKQVFYVRDNGVGFDMQHREKLFKPFQRLHRTEDFQGTGIGLATVMRIIDRHGGNIWAESEEGKGAAFFFTLTSGEMKNEQ